MVSIIIVNYHVKKELFACIKSIFDSKPKNSFEIIVVDNDEIKTIEKDLHKTFPKVKYIPNENHGFGQGNNKGAQEAKGNYFFFLNPDTKIYSKTIDVLIEFLNKKKRVGVVAPLLYDNKNHLYPQGANELTPVASIFSFSFIHKLFPNNPIAKKYWLHDEWDRKSPKEVASIPGTAFIIRRKIYEQIKGFDEKFFMYFEEHDLCKRVRAIGWKIMMLPQSKVYHALGRSSQQVSGINQVFIQSRFYYLRKHFGLLNALFAESFLRFNKYIALLLGILFLNFFLVCYRLSDLMSFIGDQGWFYLSARDMLHGNIPLVGIESSRQWLHQGAFWTYLLAGFLALFQFNPLSGAYLAISLGLISIVLLYFVSSNLFTKRVGIIAAFLFATSPLVIMHLRAPYHTTPIPLFTILYLYALYKWTQGRINYLPVIIGLLAILYNFQVSTFLLTISFMIIALYGLIKKKAWLISSLKPRIVCISFLAFLIPMLPMLIYDFVHGFPQTGLFLAWVVYKIATVLGYPSLHPGSSEIGIKTVLSFIADSYKKLIYIPDALVAFTIAIFSFGYLIKKLVSDVISQKHNNAEYILSLLIFISISGIIVTKTASDAYLPILFPMITLVTAIFFDKLMTVRQYLSKLIILILVLMAFMNSQAIINQNYYIGKGTSLSERIATSKEVVSQANGRSYNLIGKGNGSQFESFTMNYQYLTWWLGNEPVKTPVELKFVITETKDGVTLNQYD